MPILKYIAVHKSPLRLLRYMTKEGKTENALVSGICCPDNIDKAYEEMKWVFEYHSSERFNKKSLELKSEIPKKEKVRLHHYIQSFKPGEVSAAEAHEIAREWARAMFGGYRPIFISTHIDKGHIHNHIAVCPYDLNGEHWNENKETLKRCRAVSDRIAKQHNLSVIEKPKYKANHKYKEHIARQNNYSWKQQLCNNIDEIISMPTVRNVDNLIDELKNKGYEINRGKYLSIKPKNAKRAIRTFRLGDGYSLEHLQYRIENKNLEMPLSAVLQYEGAQREWAMCVRQIQIDINRKPEQDRLHLATYQEVVKSLDVLNYLSENGIHSVEEFERKVNAAEKKVSALLDERQELLDKISEQEKFISEIPVYLEIRSRKPLLNRDLEELKKYHHLKLAGVRSAEDNEIFHRNIAELQKQLSELDGRIAEAKSKSKHVSDLFQTFTHNLKSDYEIFLERAKAEIEEIRLADEQRIAEQEEKRLREEYEEYPYYYNNNDER